MDREFSFEAMPFAFASGGEFQESSLELEGLEWEEEFRGRSPSRRGGFGSRLPRGARQRYKRPLPPSRKRPKKPRHRLPCPPGRPCPPWGIVGGPYGVVSEPYPVEPTYPMEPEPAGSEHIRWVQDCLNQVLRLQLPLNGVMGVETRSAVRRFQRQQGLPVRGIVGPDTEEALKRACSGAAPQASDDAQAAGEFGLEAEEEGLGDIFGRITSGIGSAYGATVDVLGGTTGPRIIDLTAKADKSVRKGTRDLKTVYALVLHQMACCFKPKDPLKRFLSLGAHFAILPDGRILQLHPISALVWASNRFNNCSVAVEFAGNFPNVKGRWWKGEKYGRNHPTQAQFEAGRYLIRHLMRTMGLTHVLAHRQSSGTRENDPGPDIWYHVGQWAVDNLGLKDGRPGFKIGTGNPIPDAWRTWARRPVAPEMSPELEAELSETELAHDVWQGEDHARSPEYVRWIQRSLNEVSGLRLPLNGIAGPATRSAVRSFQRQQGLPVSGIVEADTEYALKAAHANAVTQAAYPEKFGSIGETEVAAAMKGALAQLPAQQRPNYKSVGRLADAINKVKGPGLYLIMFNADGKRKAYSGKADDLKRRLMQHRLCAQMLGLSVDNHRVLVAPPPIGDLRATEKTINTYVRAKHKDVFTNQRTELEEALLGESWV